MPILLLDDTGDQMPFTALQGELSCTDDRPCLLPPSGMQYVAMDLESDMMAVLSRGFFGSSASPTAGPTKECNVGADIRGKSSTPLVLFFPAAHSELTQV